MMRTWTTRILTALIAVSLAAASVHAGPESVTTDEKLNQILSQLDRLTQVPDQIQDLKMKVNRLQANQDLQIKTTQEDIERLRAEVNRLSDDVKRLSTTTNIAASINPAPVLPAAGAILLDHRYVSPATVFINGLPYRLMPFEQRRVVHPVGAFNYAVYTDNYGLVQGVTNRFLVPNRDFPITINP
jgi:predicted PurR-regulated permease PerM